MQERLPITGIILAGGKGRRMGGRDKGLIPFRGQPLVVWGLRRLKPQVKEVFISANRHLKAYQALGVPVLTDTLGEGPLAGILRGLEMASCPFLLTLPCDAPFAPDDLGERLHRGLEERKVPLALARGQRLQPLFALISRDLLEDLRATLKRRDYRVEGWMMRHPHAIVDFPQPEAFVNLNTPEDHRRCP